MSKIQTVLTVLYAMLLITLVSCKDWKEIHNKSDLALSSGQNQKMNGLFIDWVTAVEMGRKRLGQRGYENRLDDMASYGTTALFPTIWNQYRIMIQSQVLQKTLRKKNLTLTAHYGADKTDRMMDFVLGARQRNLKIYFWPENGLQIGNGCSGRRGSEKIYIKERRLFACSKEGRKLWSHPF